MPHLPAGFAPADVVQFLLDAYNAQALGWSEIDELRKSRQAALRRWLHEAANYQRRPLSAATLTELARLQANKLQEQSRGLLRRIDMTAAGATAGTGVILALLGMPVAHPEFLVGGGAVLSIATGVARYRFQSQLERVVARVLATRSQRLLVDTAFFASAQFKAASG